MRTSSALVLLLLAACDGGVSGNTHHGYVAVGAVQQVTFKDSCTHDVSDRGSPVLVRCTDQSVKEVRSATASGPFAVESSAVDANSGIASVHVRAQAKGDGKVTAELLLADGKTERVSVTVRAREIRTVTATFY